MDASATPPLEELLAHAGWARALAYRLVRDEQRADDVVQQAWLAAVERPPAAGPGLRAWFARLIRNVASNQRRAELRRLHHEQSAAAPEFAPPPPPAAIVDEFAAQQLVAQALLALDEPYRETLLRRWYRDEKPAAIARAMAVPVKTVETRLARGLERLRAQLTELRGGDARSWALMLVPLAKQAPLTVAEIAGSVGSIAAGVAAMSIAAKLLAAGVVVAATATTWVVVAHRGARDEAGASKTNTAPAGQAVAPLANAEAKPSGDAPVAAQRMKEESDGTKPPATAARDPFATIRGAWHLRGRVVSKGNRAPIEGAEVTATFAPNGSFFLGAPLATAVSDARGEFTLERLTEAIRLSIHAKGFLSLDERLEAKELLAAADAPPRELELEAPTYGELVATLKPRDGGAIPPAIVAKASVCYSPAEITGDFYERFDRLPKPVANGPSSEMIVPFERDGVRFHVDHVPATVPIQVEARLDHSQIGRLRVEPLAPGERREVAIPIECGIVVAARCVDAASGARLDMKWANSWPPIVLRWTGGTARDHLEREISPTELDGSISLPGPGHVAVEGAVDGFGPFTCSADVKDGDELPVPLTHWRPVLIKVVTRDGAPPSRRAFGKPGQTPTTRCDGMGFMAAGRSLASVVVAAGAPLPTDLAPNELTIAHLREWMGRRFTMAGFEGFAPSIPLRVGVYDDGHLVGSADLPAVAPLLTPDPPPPPPSGKVGEIIPDPPAEPWASRFGPTQSITVVVTLPSPADGSLQFQAVGAEDGQPIASYQVEFNPVVSNLFGEFESPPGTATYKVEDPKHGLFSCTAIPAGDWRMRIRRGASGVDVWSGTITIEADHATDLGELTLLQPGLLDVRVVDESGAPLADAEVVLTTRDDDTPLEFGLRPGRDRLTRAVTDSQSRELHLEVAAQPLRVHARSAGYAAAFTDVDVSASGKTICTLMLRPSTPSSH
jgi:RNA polymerase sigma factor (sigma-70 family)